MKLIMAPMRGYTDYVYRKVWASYFSGIDEAVSPFIALNKESDLSLKTLKDFLPFDDKALPLVPQVLTNKVDIFLALDSILADAGYKEINWNLACPFPMVAKKNKGSGLLPYPDRVAAFLDELCAEAKLKISLKIRLGRHNKEEMEDLIPVFNSYPLERIILHPRIGVQMYKGRPDLKSFALFASLSSHKLVYNGDIWSREDFIDISRLFPDISSFMLGRGLLADPFLAERISGIKHSKEELLSRFSAFYRELESEYGKRLSGPSHLLARMKGWWAFFHLFFEGGDVLFKKLSRSNSLDVFKSLVDAFFAEEPAWRSSFSSWAEDNYRK